MSGRLPFCLLLTTLLLPSGGLFGRTWHVNPAGTGDAPTIAAAIDSVADTDIIELADGVYTGDGNRDLTNLEKAIVIVSQSGDPAACVIDCQGSANENHHGITFYGGG